jgi:hypothetical protein
VTPAARGLLDAAFEAHLQAENGVRVGMSAQAAHERHRHQLGADGR